MTEDKRSLLWSAAAPWVAASLALALVAILIMVGSDIGASNERAKIANECRQAGAFTVKRTAFDCGVRRK